MTNFTPREIVSELDRYIIGQKQAKRLWPWHCATAGGANRYRTNCAMK